MDVILSRAGLNAAQQRLVCFGALKDEVQQAEAKLADTFAALQRLREVARVAKDVHNAQASIVKLPPSVTMAVKRMTQVGRSIGPLLEEVRSSLNAFTAPGGYFGYAGSSAGEEDEEEDEQGAPSRWRQRRAAAATASHLRQSSSFVASSRERDVATFEQERQRNRYSFTTGSEDSASDTQMRGSISMRSGPKIAIIGQKRRASSPPCPVGNSFLRPTAPAHFQFPRPVERESIWPRQHEYRMLANRQRPRSPVPLTEKKIAQVLDGLKLRLSKLPGAEQEGVFFTSIKSAIEIVQLEEMEDEELHIQRAIDTARAAVKSLLDRSSRDPDSDEQHHRLEDIRQVLFAVVRATLDTREKLGASGLRDLLDLTKRVEDSFPASAARFKWCSTQLRKFVTAKYKKPAQVTLDDQNKLESIVAETRGWTDVNDYTASRFKEVMAFVTDILDGSYEDWEPREDSRLAELVAIMIVRVGAFRDSHIQKSRQFEIHGWVYAMSGSAFMPTLDLMSVPPQKPTLAYATTNQGFCSVAEVDEGFEQMAKAQEEKHFEFLALTAYTFLATAALTQNQVLLPIHQLKLFNEILQGLEKLDVNQDPKAVLRSYQTLEKVLYLMRIMMHRRPEYQQCSTSTVDTLLSLFPPSQRPSFKYPSIAKSMAENGEETDED